MNKIKTLTLENFQNHHHTIIDFDENINLITGTSNGGKTAINRAMNFVLHDEYDKGFVTLGSQFTTVTIELHDGRKFVRSKGPSKNVFTYYEPDQEPKEFHNFGSKYTDEIKKLLGNSDIVDDSGLGSLAYLGQFTPPCLTSLSSTELPRFISRLIKLDYFDSCSKKMNTEANQVESKIKDDSITLSELNEKMENYNDLDDKLIDLNRMSLIYENCSVKQSNLEILSNFYQTALNNIRQIKTVKKNLEYHQGIAGHEKSFLKIKDKNKSVEALKTFDTNYNNVTERITKLETKKRIFDMILSEANINHFEDIKRKMSLYKSSTEMVQKYEGLSVKINNNRTELERCKLITDKKIADQIKSINEKKDFLLNVQDFYATCKSQVVSYNEIKNALKAKQDEIEFYESQVLELEKLKSMKTFECSSCGTVNVIGEEVE